MSNFGLKRKMILVFIVYIDLEILQQLLYYLIKRTAQLRATHATRSTGMFPANKGCQYKIMKLTCTATRDELRSMRIRQHASSGSRRRE